MNTLLMATMNDLLQLHADIQVLQASIGTSATIPPNVVSTMNGIRAKLEAMIAAETDTTIAGLQKKIQMLQNLVDRRGG